MDLDPAICAQEPFAAVPMLSLSDYIASLRIPRGFDWQRALQTLLVKLGFPVLLPATDFISVHGGSGDPFASIGGSRLLYSILRDSMSPLHIYAVGELLNMVQSQNTGCVPEERRCTTKFTLGHQALPADLRDLPNPFIFPRHMAELTSGLDPGAPPALAAGEPAPPWLPDLYLAAVGMPKTVNAWQEQCSQVLAVILNRLATNALPAAWRPDGVRQMLPLEVRIQDDGEGIFTPEGLLAALIEELGADVDMGVVSRITGFGLGFAVKEGEAWKQVPLVIPVRTGIFMSEGVASSSGHDEVISLLSHAEVCLRGRVPGHTGFAFRVAWFQGVEGFTGWHPASESEQPWNNSAEMELWHNRWRSAAARCAAMRATTVAASVTNVAADRLRLPNGGYGYLGVCNDSVAAVQAAVGDAVTMYPCILAGRAKGTMSRTYQEYADGARGAGHAELAATAVELKAALLHAPCDVVQEPQSMPDAARRIAALIPPVTPFRTLECARKDLRAAAEQLQQQAIPVDASVVEPLQGA